MVFSRSQQLYCCQCRLLLLLRALEHRVRVLQGFRLPMRTGTQACLLRLHTSGNVRPAALMTIAWCQMLALFEFTECIFIWNKKTFQQSDAIFICKDNVTDPM